MNVRASEIRTAPSRQWRHLAATALIAVVLAGCGAAATPTPSSAPSNPGPAGQPIPTAASPAPGSPYPTLAPGELTVARGNAALADAMADKGAAAATEIDDFGFDLLRQLNATGNLVASPTSIALALGMVRPGAEGQTAAEMDKVLHSFGAAGQAGEVRALLAELATQNVYLTKDGMPIPSPDPDKDAPTVELSVADQAFIQKDYSIEAAYLDSLTSAYNAGVALVDYKNASEAARQLINTWGSDQTRGRIQQILNEGDVDAMTRLVLVNAIYLQAAWSTAFDPSLTQDRAFTTADGTTVQVPTMAIDSNYAYAAGSSYQAVDLPYSLGGLSMTIVVPDDIASFVNGLSAAGFQSILKAESDADVDLQLPRFSIQTRVELSDVLSALGMPTAFESTQADFSGITTEEPLYLAAVIHEANIDVVEKGTTASAVTAVVVAAGATRAQPERVTMHVDKPFLYFIHDTRSGAILFMGRVDDPTAK